MTSTATRITSATGEFTNRLGYIEPPFSADCNRFHIFGGTEAQTVYNYQNPASPLTKIGAPTINSDHIVCTPASGFQTPAGPYFGGTQIVVTTHSFTLATRVEALNIHFMDRGGAHWARQSGASIFFRADGGLAGTDLLSSFISGVQYARSPYIERPQMMAFTASTDALAMHLEEGTEFRSYSTVPPSLSTRAAAALRIGGYSPAGSNTVGFEAYMMLEYPARVLTLAEMNVVLKEFVQPLLEARGVRRGAGLLT